MQNNDRGALFICFIIGSGMFLLAAKAAALGNTGELFYAETYLSSHIMYPGENRTYDVSVFNMNNDTLTFDIRTSGAFGSASARTMELKGNSTGRFFVGLVIPENATNGIYPGFLFIKSSGKEITMPYVVEIRYPSISPMFFIDLVSKKIQPEDPIRIRVSIIDEGKSIKRVNMTYRMKNAVTKSTEYEFSEETDAEGGTSFIRNLVVKKSGEAYGNYTGTYYIELVADYGFGTAVKHTDAFEVYKSFWSAKRIKIAMFTLLFTAIIFIGYYSYRWYQRKKKEEARYVFPLTYTLLPQKSDRSFWVGRVAETKIPALLCAEDLLTHTIVAGSTGAGKSVAASLIAEEALMKGIPVVVFDPTAQWTGFVRKCSDKNLLDKYKAFGMNREDDPKPFRGLIKEVASSKERYDFKKLMNKGEITVFTLDKLSTDEFDEAVTNIVHEIFGVHWEESTELRLIVVFDEVHRLLEKYGGGSKGGYHALEKGAREFRKWGIGLLLCSQVTSDFKEAVAGNITTEVQMQTKSMDDIERAKEKYGLDYAKRIASEEVGTGMVQNPRYNKGKPWFVNFRPTLHNPHKIADDELKLYDAYYKEIERMEAALEEQKAKGVKEAYDLELELRLAKNSLKEGRFKMCELYLDGLRKSRGASLI